MPHDDIRSAAEFIASHTATLVYVQRKLDPKNPNWLIDGDKYVDWMVGVLKERLAHHALDSGADTAPILAGSPASGPAGDAGSGGAGAVGSVPADDAGGTVTSPVVELALLGAGLTEVYYEGYRRVLFTRAMLEAAVRPLGLGLVSCHLRSYIEFPAISRSHSEVRIEALGVLLNGELRLMIPLAYPALLATGMHLRLARPTELQLQRSVYDAVCKLAIRSR